MRRRPAKYRFDAIMDLARSVSESNPSALMHLVKTLGRLRQAEGVLSIIESKTDNPMSEIGPDYLWFDQSLVLESLGKPAHKLLKVVKGEHVVNLATDLVIPTPWNRRRIEKALVEHGPGMKRGRWRQDSNHSIQLWLPQRVAWVTNGCHSITTGIMRSEGKVIPDDVVDMTKIIKRVHTDGKHFYETKTNNKIAEVKDVEFAAIYEIGRLMLPANHSLQRRRR